MIAMSTTLAVANQKGGVAKTTTIASLAAALAERGEKVLIVDSDPRACLTFALGIDPEDVDVSVHRVLTEGVDPTEVIVTTDDGVDLWPATIDPARAEADAVLIPLRCETLSHRRVGQLLDTVHDVRRFTNRDLGVRGVLPTLDDGRTNHGRAVLDTISEAYQLDVVEPPIPKSIRFAEAPAAGRSILSTTRAHRGADAYHEVATGLRERVATAS
jgi:chromosome partitioning protein